MTSSEPTLLQLLQLGGLDVFRKLPYCGSKRCPPLIKGKGLIGVAKVPRNLGVDKSIGFGGFGILKPRKRWDDERRYPKRSYSACVTSMSERFTASLGDGSLRVPHRGGLNRDVWPGKTILDQLLNIAFLVIAIVKPWLGDINGLNPAF